MYGWTKTPLQVAFDKVLEVFDIKENVINAQELPHLLNEEQVRALEELEVILQGIGKEELEGLEPADLFGEASGWGGTYEPVCLLYDYKSYLLVISTLLDELGKRAQMSFALLSAEISRALEMIDEVSEEYARGVFASKLKYLAEKKGLTQKDIASQLLLSQQSVNLWFNGKGYPNIPTLLALSVLLGTELNFLLRPDSLEMSLDSERLLLNTGLSSESSKILKQLVKDKRKDVIATLNIIIEQNEGNNLLSVLNEYFRMPFESNLSVIPFAELLDLQQTMELADCKEDAISYAKGFLENYIDLDVQGFRKYQLDKIQLIEVFQALTRLRDKRVKDFY